MVNTIIYSEHLEPITCLKMSSGLADHIQKHGVAKVAVSDPRTGETRGLDIKLMKFYLDDRTFPFYYVDEHQEALALSVDPEFLPGQEQKVQFFKRTIKHLRNRI